MDDTVFKFGLSSLWQEKNSAQDELKNAMLGQGRDFSITPSIKYRSLGDQQIKASNHKSSPHLINYNSKLAESLVAERDKIIIGAIKAKLNRDFSLADLKGVLARQVDRNTGAEIFSIHGKPIVTFFPAIFSAYDLELQHVVNGSFEYRLHSTCHQSRIVEDQIITTRPSREDM